MFMTYALRQAKEAFHRGEVPVGAVIVNRKNNTIIATGHNLVESTSNITAHAEIVAIQHACTILKCKYLYGYDIYVNLEPCVMCAAAISSAKIDRIFFGAYDLKFGAIENGVRLFYHMPVYYRPEVYGGIMELESKSLMQAFFRTLRVKKSTFEYS